MGIHAKDDFQKAYDAQPPWDIGRPQKPLVEAADQVRGAVLDSGCGTGETAIFFSERGHEVVGVDYLEAPIDAARQKAAERGAQVRFLVWDALRLDELPNRFDSVIDSGLFHVFSDEDRARYVEQLARVLRPGGRLYLLCFSDREPGEQGPRRVSEQELRAAFADGWRIESLAPARFEVAPNLPDLNFSEGGPHAWFAVVERGA
jgi:SAM-dependent methyltransferase